IHLFFSLILTPPRSPLFPYTTLFRSQAQLELRRRLVDLVHHQGVARGDEPVLEPAARDPGSHDHDVPRRRLGRGFALTVHDGLIDRKSTRMNSSHVAISYAVFCLKKK